MRKIYFEVGDIVRFGDEDFIVCGRKAQRSFKLCNKSSEIFWTAHDILAMYNIPAWDEDMSGVTGNR